MSDWRTEAQELQNACSKVFFKGKCMFTDIRDAAELEPERRKYMAACYASLTRNGRFYHHNERIYINVPEYAKMPLPKRITLIYHEMIHQYNARHDIKDVDIIDGWQFHNAEFAKAVKQHRGKCLFVDDRIGNHDIELTTADMREVKRLATAEIAYLKML